MAKTFTAPFAQAPKINTAVCTAAGVITTDSPTNTLLLLTAGADGCIVTKVTAMPRATVTATALYLFTSNDAGTTKRIKDSALMAAYTLAATTENTPTIFTRITETNPIRLAANERIYCSAGVALTDGIIFSTESVDF